MSDFPDLTLAQAEGQLVGACIDSGVALTMTEGLLPEEGFRSRAAHDLNLVFFALLGWRERRAYDPRTNRERLADLYLIAGPRASRQEWEGFIDSLWCPWWLVDDYVLSLARAVADHAAILSATLDALKSWRSRPFTKDLGPASAPPATTSAVGPFRRGGTGGVSI